MHSAPSVEYPAGRSVFELRLQILVVAVWGTMQVVWLLAQGTLWPPGAWWVSLWGGVAAAGYAGWRRRHTPAGVLRWDATSLPAGQWSWESAAYKRGTPLVRVDRAVDLQALVLLRLQTAAGLVLWVWADRHSAPAQWHALRCALVAHPCAFSDEISQARTRTAR